MRNFGYDQFLYNYLYYNEYFKQTNSKANKEHIFVLRFFSEKYYLIIIIIILIILEIFKALTSLSRSLRTLFIMFFSMAL